MQRSLSLASVNQVKTVIRISGPETSSLLQGPSKTCFTELTALCRQDAVTIVHGAGPFPHLTGSSVKEQGGTGTMLLFHQLTAARVSSPSGRTCQSRISHVPFSPILSPDGNRMA